MQSIEAFLFIGGTVRIFLFFHRPFHRVVEVVEMAPPRPHPKSASGGSWGDSLLRIPEQVIRQFFASLDFDGTC
jgi:hypothetical protein